MPLPFTCTPAKALGVYRCLEAGPFKVGAEVVVKLQQVSNGDVPVGRGARFVVCPGPWRSDYLTIQRKHWFIDTGSNAAANEALRLLASWRAATTTKSWTQNRSSKD